MNTSLKKTEIYPYIHQITLPLPGKKPGPVNCYLFIGDKITLLDTGTSRHGPRLIEALENLGIQTKDIDQVVLTHGHIDHCGAAQELLEHAGSRPPVVISHEGDRYWVEGSSQGTRKQGARFMKLSGLPRPYRLAMRILDRVFSRMARHCTVDKIVSDGDELLLGSYPARVIATPGHSRGSICLWLPGEKILFSGDTVLPHITPNAFVMTDDNQLPERISQEEFYHSLSILEPLHPEIVFPGHGEPIDSLQEVLNMYRQGYRIRDQAILDIIKENEFTVYEIARLLFPNLEKGKRKILDIYLAVSEVFTHLQVLQKKGKVTWQIRRKRLIVRSS